MRLIKPLMWTFLILLFYVILAAFTYRFVMHVIQSTVTPQKYTARGV